jgi:type II secretory pathway pseudopilin PulG
VQNRALTPVLQRGFTYIALLIGVAIIGGVLAAIGELASHAQQREKEAELLFAGRQIRDAIGAYYELSPGGAKAYPKTLEDLLEDKRMPVVTRYLRKVYRDPITGRSDWGVVEGPGGGIMGVYSKSETRPLKSGSFPRGDESFGDAKAYTEWKFTHSPLGLVPAQPDTAKQ